MDQDSRPDLFRRAARLTSRLRDAIVPRRGRPTPGAAIIAGSSHVMCFGLPLRAPRLGLVPLNGVEGRFLCLNGPFPRSRAYWHDLERLARTNKVFIYWQGNQHMAEHLFASSPPFDFVLSTAPDLPLVPDAEIVPEQMIRDKFARARSFDRLGMLVARIAERGTPGLHVCGTPPPKGDRAAIRAALAREEHFVERLARLGSDPASIALTAPETLYKMWSVIQSLLCEVAQTNGATFVPFPVEAQTPAGFLSREFWAEDITHANATLGPVVLDRLKRYL